ncbi:carbohydrate ABC transporter ATP-binding protein, CUT1 family [Rubellimicrobium thermophilum DSM 16684]|uniref:Carbohydrate ABC transporter ATP-binding protein, CUT1 family n=1 Tax=Rubellimicrobium thermophilum DSM 16684 TaxID=1123069 RepID=S9R3B0_9RHOB|nr:sn-glycerol-3-phosphate ABC transporter ATP-binding protein UgpC [Rubellimicrobium thermophilum]EPX86412.1 carbohydrate ABC transporter ATP-binding protein, CUT1 family [Rubellimicrobium thermophilum DSM 16684]
MADVAIRDLRKSYGAVEVIHGIDLDIPDGEFVVLVGPSGCGKSTLLRMIAGLEGISSGTIRIGDRVVNNLPPSERDIAMVFQNYALYPHKTVAANMGFALKMRGMPRAEIEERVGRAADILGLRPYLDRYPRALSGGQRQRVAMGRAIVRDPKVFLFDEPLSNLDAKLRVQMRTEIRALHQRLRTTTVYVTHDQIEAMTMADRIVVLREGHIAQAGAPLDLYDRPANIFVAGFIGSPAMNLIEGIGQGGAVQAGGLRLPAPGAPEGRSVIFGIRPEHLEIGEGWFEATVRVVEPTGSETHLVADAGGQEIVVVSRDRLALRPGDRVPLRADPARAHLFDAATGQRLN